LLFESLGCAACHGPRAPRSAGPSLGGLYGRRVKLDYREAIRAPQTKIVEGHVMMPTFLMSDRQLDDLVLSSSRSPERARAPRLTRNASQSLALYG
jgi:mono/diheme cytochrome c family protein